MKWFSKIDHEQNTAINEYDMAWVMFARIYRMEGKERYYLGWALRIWVPAYEWGRDYIFDNECWLQGSINIISVDERGFPAPWQWSYTMQAAP